MTLQSAKRKEEDARAQGGGTCTGRGTDKLLLSILSSQPRHQLMAVTDLRIRGFDILFIRGLFRLIR